MAEAGVPGELQRGAPGLGRREVTSYLPGFPSLPLSSHLCLKQSRLKVPLGNTDFFDTMVHEPPLQNSAPTLPVCGKDFLSPSPFTCTVWNIFHIWPVTILPGSLKKTAIYFYFVLYLVCQDRPSGTSGTQILCSNQPLSGWI